MPSDPTHWLFVALVALVMLAGLVFAAYEHHVTRHVRRERRRRSAEYRQWSKRLQKKGVA